MIYGYVRTNNNEDLANYEETLKAYGCEVIFGEVCSANSVDRPVFNEMLSALKQGDKVVVTSVIRFARSISTYTKFVSEIAKRGAALVIISCSDDIGVLLKG